MIRFKKLLGEIFLSIKSLSKKAFTKGLVIISAGMVTVLLLGMNGFIVNNTTNPPKINEFNEDENTIEENILDLQTADAKDLPQSNIEALSTQENLIEYQASLVRAETNVVNEIISTTETSPTLIKEEEGTNITLKTASTEPKVQEDAIIYTEQDYMALVKIVEAEATGEDMIGKIMVANVVLNRVRSSEFPDTIYDVIYERYNGRAQFSPVDDGRIDSVPLTEESYEAVDRALKGEDYSNGATFFVARALSSDSAVSWFEENLKKVAEHGVHEFYTYY